MLASFGIVAGALRLRQVPRPAGPEADLGGNNAEIVLDALKRPPSVADGSAAATAGKYQSVAIQPVVDQGFGYIYIGRRPATHPLAQKYPKPPIIEAALHVRYAAPLADGELKRIPRLLEPEYPKSKEENEFRLRVRLKQGVPTGKPEPEVTDRGARMLSANDQRVVVTRQGGVLYACQAPYHGWDDFVAGAHFVFDTLREKLGYKEMSSIGLRYINRIDVPLGDDTALFLPAEYLLAGVALPENGITNSLRLFQVITEIEIGHDRLIDRIAAATANEALINHASLLFDIDIISQVDVPRKPDEFWALLDRMRNAKNSIFESGVTDKARRLFGWRQ